jgi:hypothetical protein
LGPLAWRKEDDPERVAPDESRRYAYREGKKTVSATVTIEKWKTLRRVVTETQRTANDLLDEAITLLDEKYGQPPRQPKGRKARSGDPSP